MDTLILKDGYDRRVTKQEAMFRTMTLDEVKTLRSGQRISFRDMQGNSRMLTVNGKPKTWKRDPLRVEIPVKYGLYAYDRFEWRSDRCRNTSGCFLIIQLESN